MPQHTNATMKSFGFGYSPIFLCYPGIPVGSSGTILTRQEMGAFFFSRAQLCSMANKKEGAGQSTQSKYCRVLQLSSKLRGFAVVSSVFFHSPAVHEVHLLRSPLVSDEKRLWKFRHG